jgi:hypothetical protein
MKKMSQNLFTDTHAELHELNAALSELQEEYKFNIDYDDDTNNEDDHEENILPIDDDTVLSVFTDAEIEEFYRIWNKDPLHYEESEAPEAQDQFNEKLQEQDIDAFQKKLKATSCCSKNCLADNIINHEVATKKFQLFQNLNKSQQNMFLLGMLNANVRPNVTNRNKDKMSLTSDYYFEGIKICMAAFLTIYGIGKKKWGAIRKHYSENDIAPVVHGLTGRKSNNAIPFETILQILTFVTNYANTHGLPSPGALLSDFFKQLLSLLINKIY